MILKNKVAIITGASRGIGKAIALSMAKEGANLIVSGTNDLLLIDLCKEARSYNVDCHYIKGDIRIDDTRKKIVELALRLYGRIDILINNAGINIRSNSLDLSINDWRDVIEVNLTATFAMCQKVLPKMIDNNYGIVINISSSTSKTPHPNAAPCYGASKAGVNYITQHLALEMAKFGIRVIAVCPGPIETDMSKQWSLEYRELLINKIPLKRIGSTDSVANLVTFLASDKADFITGEIININGGTYMN